MNIEVLYEDNHLIAVNKPAGLVVQDNEHGLPSLEEHVKEYIRVKYDKPGAVFLGCIHRLDTNVTGIVLFARTSKALVRMNEQFKDRTINKTYAALIRNKPQPMAGTLTHWLKKDPKQNKTKLYDEEREGSKKAVLHYQFINTANHCFLVKVNPVTGRPHQIRVQLARTFTGIIGDVKYGQAKPTSDKSIYLHALGLSFNHPVTKEKLNLYAPMPKFGNWKFFNDVEQNLLEE
jgi:23S rRNA pseudouridine1911/1915/1917 synthase